MEGIPNPWAMAVGHVKAKATAGRVILMPQEKSQPGARAKLAMKQAMQRMAREQAAKAGLGGVGNRKTVMPNMWIRRRAQVHTVQAAKATEGRGNVWRPRCRRHHQRPRGPHPCMKAQERHLGRMQCFFSGMPARSGRLQRHSSQPWQATHVRSTVQSASTHSPMPCCTEKHSGAWNASGKPMRLEKIWQGTGFKYVTRRNSNSICQKGQGANPEEHTRLSLSSL